MARPHRLSAPALLALLALVPALQASEGSVRRKVSAGRPLLVRPEAGRTAPRPHPAREKRPFPDASYPMEHFRWSKPCGNKTREAAKAPEAKRGYSMEHFRWGKPPGSAAEPGRKGSRRSPPQGHERRARGEAAGRKRKPLGGSASPPGKDARGLLAAIYRDILLKDVQRMAA